MTYLCVRHHRSHPKYSARFPSPVVALFHSDAFQNPFPPRRYVIGCQFVPHLNTYALILFADCRTVPVMVTTIMKQLILNDLYHSVQSSLASRLMTIHHCSMALVDLTAVSPVNSLHAVCTYQTFDDR